MKRSLAAGLVAVQLLLIAALVLIPNGTLWPLFPAVLTLGILLGIAGLMVAILGVLGLGPALTASPIPRDRAPLITGGLYGWVRHPIYTGLLLGGVGLVVLGASASHLALWLGLFLLLAVKSRWEERMLLDEHPHYRDYAADVGRFVPGVGKLRQ